MDLPVHIKKAVDRFQPITIEGVTVYPIIVDEIEEYGFVKPALEFMQQVLPVALMQIPILTAFYQLELASNAMSEGNPNVPKTNLFTQCVYALLLALRLGQGMERNERIAKRCVYEHDKDDPLKLTKVFLVNDEGKIIEITPRLFQRLRPIIAAQNGSEIPPENANPDIVLAERSILADKAPKINREFGKMVAWVSAKCGVEETDVYQWPILRFLRRAEVLQRELDYLIYGIGQAGGMVTYKDGNPCPSPYFEKITDAVQAKMLKDIGNGAAEKAVSVAMQNQISNSKGV